MITELMMPVDESAKTYIIGHTGDREKPAFKKAVGNAERIRLYKTRSGVPSEYEMKHERKDKEGRPIKTTVSNYMVIQVSA